MAVTLLKKYLVFITLIIFNAILFACSSEDREKKPPVFAVEYEKITLQEIPIIKQYIGMTESPADIEIRARVSGFLIEKHFTEGQAVEKDQLIYVIDPQPFEAKLLQAQATLESNIAEEQFQSLEYARFKKLVEKGNVAKYRFDEVSAKLKEAKASVALAKADIDQAELDLSYCYMRAPFAGRIGVKYVDVGNYVGGASKTLLATIVQLDPIYVEFSPSVGDYAEFLQYRSNMPFNVKVTFPSDDKTEFSGVVDLVNNEANSSTSTILMRASIDNPDETLIPGIYVDVNLIISEKSKEILIPSDAIMDQQGAKVVYVLGEKNNVESKNIIISNPYQSKTIIKSGLKVGDKIITNNLQKIRPGSIVNPHQAQ